MGVEYNTLQFIQERLENKFSTNGSTLTAIFGRNCEKFDKHENESPTKERLYSKKELAGKLKYAHDTHVVDKTVIIIC